MPATNHFHYSKNYISHGNLRFKSKFFPYYEEFLKLVGWWKMVFGEVLPIPGGHNSSDVTTTQIREDC